MSVYSQTVLSWSQSHSNRITKRLPTGRQFNTFLRQHLEILQTLRQWSRSLDVREIFVHILLVEQKHSRHRQ